jgi:hypothetical protein
MKRSLFIYDFSPDPSDFLTYEENFIFFFISVKKVNERKRYYMYSFLKIERTGL